MQFQCNKPQWWRRRKQCTYHHTALNSPFQGTRPMGRAREFGVWWVTRHCFHRQLFLDSVQFFVEHPEHFHCLLVNGTTHCLWSQPKKAPRITRNAFIQIRWNNQQSVSFWSNRHRLGYSENNLRLAYSENRHRWLYSENRHRWVYSENRHRWVYSHIMKL